MGKRGDAETKHCCVNVMAIDWQRRVGVGAMWVHDIWWDSSNWEVVKAFIELGMSGNFDATCFWVMPKDVWGGEQHTPKEDTSTRVGDEFRCLFPW